MNGMNEAKCCTATPTELLNDIAQDIIDRLIGVNNLANAIEDRMYGSEPQETCNAKESPSNLKERLLCIRSQVNKIGSTLEDVQKKV